MYKVIEARYTNAEQDTIVILHNVDDSVVEEYIQVGSAQHKALEEAGYDHDKIVDMTAEWKQLQARMVFDRLTAAATEQWAEINKTEEEKVRKKLAKVEAKLVAEYKEKEAQLQEDYQKLQHLYGLGVIDILFSHNDDKEVLFKTKIDVLEKDFIRKQSKELKARIRKATKLSEIFGIVSEVL